MDLEKELAAQPELMALLAGESGSSPAQLLSLKIKLLWDCNLDCRFCRRPVQRPRLPSDLLRCLAGEAALLGVKKVHFSGGEVLLLPELFDILKSWSGEGVQVNLTTNGTLLGKDAIRRLEQARVHAVSISLDAATPALHDRLRGRKGAHKATLAAIRQIAGRGKIRLRINTVVTSRNWQDLEPLHELVAGFGNGVVWKLIPVDAVRKSLLPSAEAVAALAAAAASWGELENRFPYGETEQGRGAALRGRYGRSRGRCHVPGFHLFVAPDGNLFPCCMSSGRVPPIGNLLEAPLVRCLESPQLAIYRQAAGGGRCRALPSGTVEPAKLLRDACLRCDDFLEENSIIERLLEQRGRGNVA